ncbi:hypothetical protein EBR25_04660 [bacterium]|nr:hypothetical protein [bacterium]
MPKKFKFRLQRVLEYRKLLKDGLHKALLEKNQTVSDLEKKEEQILQSLSEAKITSPVTSGELMSLLGNYITRLRGELAVNEENLLVARRDQQEALIQYREAAKEEEVLKRLKEKKLSAYTEKYEKEEASFLDEIGTLKGNMQFGEK